MGCVQKEGLHVGIYVTHCIWSLITMNAMAHVFLLQNHVLCHPQHRYHQVFAAYAARNVIIKCIPDLETDTNSIIKDN